MDNIQLRTGELFKGIRDLPNGAHYIYHTTAQGIIGFFIYTDRQNVHVRKWNKETESYEKLSSSDEELFIHNVQELYPLMASYTPEKLKLWHEVSNFIDKNLILTLEPGCHGIYRSEAEYDNTESDIESFSSLTCPAYCTVPKRMNQYGSTPEQITSMNMDKSLLLYQLVDSLSGEDKLLGEMQYSFISFILGQSLEAFQHWKDILILVCNCERALHERSDLYLKLIRNIYTAVVYTQILQVSEDLLEDTFLSSSFISVSLRVSFI